MTAEAVPALGPVPAELRALGVRDRVALIDRVAAEEDGPLTSVEAT